jgi:transmembrane sensor
MGLNMGSSRQEAEEAAAGWIARRDAGAWSDAEAESLQAWLDESPGNRVAYYRFNAAWQETGRLQALLGASSAAVAEAARAKRWSRPQMALAAGVVLAIGAALLLSQSPLLRGNVYSTAVGGLQTVPMADGSRVTLNTDSKLNVALGEFERHIELERGEAFFEVARDPARPFVVTAGSKRVVAVGTAFSVRREGEDLHVIVSQGVVRVESPGDRSISLKSLPAGSIVDARHDGILVRRQSIDEMEKHLTWREGLLTFRDTPLADAVAEFNRYNTRQIVIESPQIASLQIGGIFRATKIEPFVQLLQQGFPVRATVAHDRILLNSR